MADTSWRKQGQRPIDEDFLRDIGVLDVDVAEEWFVLAKNKVRTVDHLCAFSSEEKLERLRAKNEQGEEVALGAGTVGLLWRFVEEQARKKAENVLSDLPPLKPKEKPLVVRSYDYVEHDAFKYAKSLVTRMLDIAPTDEGRRFAYPALVGPMGIGKTRTCEEICDRAVDECSPENGRKYTFLVIKVNVQYFSQAATSEQTDSLNVLAQAMMFGALPELDKSKLARVRFNDAVAKIKEAGYTKVLLYLDEVQVDRVLVEKLLEACDRTVRNVNLELPVVPLASGLTSPNFKTLPSGARLEEIEVGPFKVTDEPLRNKFCAAIKVDKESLDKAPHLLTLFTLCDGRPNLVSALIDAIETLRSKLDLPNILVHHAKEIFDIMVNSISDTYGVGRWHSLFGGQSGSPRTVRKRESFREVTCALIRRLLLDAYTDRRVNPNDPVLSLPGPASRDRVPTYESCIDSGMFSMPDDVVRIPLLGLLVMDGIVNLLPHEALKNPFDQSWGKLELVGMAAIYLRLLSAGNLGNETMKLKDLRPGADWSGCDDLDILVPKPEDLRFVFLGAKIAAETDSINEGADGLGRALKLLPGIVAFAFNNQPGWDGFTFLETESKTSLVLATQVKSRDANVGNGVPSLTKLGNAAVKNIIREKMAPVFAAFTGVYKPAITDECEVVYDVFSDRFDPANPTLGLESVTERYCLTRDEVFKEVTGTPLAGTVAKRGRFSPKSSDSE